MVNVRGKFQNLLYKYKFLKMIKETHYEHYGIAI